MTRRSLRSTVVSAARTAVASAAILAAFAIVGCSEAPAEAPKPAERPAVEVALAPVERSPWPRTVEVVGTIFGEDETRISAKVAGRILAIRADLGDRVGGSAVLAEIDPVDYQLELTRRRNALSEALSKIGLAELPRGEFDVNRVPTVERARYQSENAKSRFERAKRLFEQKPPLISEQDFADLQTAYDVAMRDADVARLEAQSNLAAAQSRQSDLKVAEQALADTQIRAPALADRRTYAVAQRSVSVGEYVSAGTAAYRLVLDHAVKFRGALPERVAGALKTGQNVTLQIAGQDEPATGTVTRISPAIDVSTRTFEIEATFDNAAGRLRPGAFVRGVVTVGDDADVAVVPQTAVTTYAGMSRVYSVKDGKAVEHPVTARATRGDMVALNEKIDGVQAVVVRGGDKLAGGVPVKETAATPPATQPSP
jgi:RND family efflux transporter MFP subunit